MQLEYINMSANAAVDLARQPRAKPAYDVALQILANRFTNSMQSAETTVWVSKQSICLKKAAYHFLSGDPDNVLSKQMQNRSVKRT